MKKNPNSSGQRNSLPQLRGAGARKWRHELAASSTRPADAVRTLKFKLEFPPGTVIGFDAVRALNQVVDGVGKGSLTGLLFAVHSCGFRIFMQEGGAVQFRQKSGGTGSGFAEALEAASGLKFKGFDPPGLQARFSKRPRARAGKDIRFVPEIIAGEYVRHFVGKNLADVEPAVSTFFQEWAAVLHHEFAAEADGWVAIEANPTRAARTFDTLATAKGWNLPSTVIVAAEGGSEAWKSCTVAFDANQPTLDPQSPAAIHAIVAVRLQQLRAAGVDFSDKARAQLQESITTQTSGGLSWLFGAGLNYLRAAETVEEAAKGLGVPAGYESQVAPLLSAAKAVPSDPLFGAKGYADYRRLVGGRLDSWVANYLSRLVQLQDLLSVQAERFVLPAVLVDNWGTWFGRMPLDAVRVQALLDAAFERREGARVGLAALTGESGEVVTIAHVQAVEGYSQIASEAAGALVSLKKILAPEENDGAKRREGMPAAALVASPAWLEELPKLNSFTGAIPDFEGELQQAAEAYAELDTTYGRFREGLRTLEIAPPADTYHSVIWRMAAKWLAERDAEFASNNTLDDGRLGHARPIGLNHPRWEDAQLDVLRKVAHRFGRAALTCSEATRRAVRDFYVEQGVLANSSDANRFFMNQQGAIWRSEYSKSRHEVYEAGPAILVDYPHILVFELAAFISRLNSSNQDSTIPKADVIRLQHAFDLIVVGNLGRGALKLVAQECRRFKFDERYVRIPESLKLAMQQTDWTADTAAAVLNLVRASRLSMLSLLERKRFFIRARFQRVGDTALAYRAKDRPWNVPGRLVDTDAPIGDAIKTFKELTAEAGGTVQPVDGLGKVLADKAIPLASVAAYLQQAPHDWFYSPGFVGAETSSGWLSVDGKTGRSPKLSKQSVGGRLVGSPSYKSELAKLLLAEGAATFGDITLIFDQEFNQTMEALPSEQLSPQLTPGAMTVSVAIPLTVSAVEKRPFPYANRVVAIDQGEAGIGFAVLDVRTREVIASGSRRIPSIRRLIQKAKQYRTVTQKSQKFQQRFDSTMFVMRENVVGDVCHVICELMHAYKAFPVVESQVGNLEGGSRQLDLVYKAVTARFVYSEVPAHGTERKSFWMGGDRWEHPYLLAEAWEDGKKSGKSKPLSLFPGARAPTAGTSQQCSECRRNPIRELRDVEASGTKQLEVSSGRVVLPGGMLQLFVPTEDVSEQRAAWRRNERLAPSRPVTHPRMPISDVISLARRNLRQAPKSRQSRDTTQSTYQCISAACGNRMHADENAARNIGRRFLEEKVRIAIN